MNILLIAQTGGDTSGVFSDLAVFAGAGLFCYWILTRNKGSKPPREEL